MEIKNTKITDPLCS